MKKIVIAVLCCAISVGALAAGAGYVGFAENGSGLSDGAVVNVRADDGCSFETVMHYYAPRKKGGGYVGWRLDIRTATCSGESRSISGYAPIGGPVFEEQALGFVIDAY